MCDELLAAIGEPVRLAACPPVIRALTRASQAQRVSFVGAAGERRTRMPMAVIAASFFLRAGHVLPTAMLDILYRDEFSGDDDGDDWADFDDEGA